jgi:predicted ester cyclase
VATAEHLAFVERMIAAQNGGDPTAWAALYAEDVSNHGRPAGRAGIQRIFEALYTIFPDWHMDLREVLSDGDEVVAVMTMTGTHLGKSDVPVLGGGLVGVEPTGAKVTVGHMHRYRLRDGLVQDHVALRDDLGMMQQLGLVQGVAAAQDISRPAR